jgi:hypothetical protein
VPDWEQADLRPAARVRRPVAAWRQQRRQGGALPFSLGQDLLQPPVQVVDQLGDACLLGHDPPNPLANLGGVAGVGEVAVAARAGQDGRLGGSTDQRATVRAAQLQVQRPWRGGVHRALAQPTACHLQRQHPVAAVCPTVMTRRGVGVVIQRQDELTGRAEGGLVAEPDHLRVALATTAWQVLHGPRYRQPPQGFANGQPWPSPVTSPPPRQMMKQRVRMVSHCGGAVPTQCPGPMLWPGSWRTPNGLPIRGPGRGLTAMVAIAVIGCSTVPKGDLGDSR